MYKHKQFLNYICLKKQILEDDLFACIQFINMTKEHRHDKIKSKHINKFKCLVRKHGGYLHNHQQNLGHPQIPLWQLQPMFLNKTVLSLQQQGKLQKQKQQQPTPPQQQLPQFQHLQPPVQPTTQRLFK